MRTWARTVGATIAKRITFISLKISDWIIVFCMMHKIPILPFSLGFSLGKGFYVFI